MNKFDNFYSGKSTIELLDKLRTAKISPASIEKEWHDALITHLNNRELSPDEKNIMEKILSSDSETLKSEAEKYTAIMKEQLATKSPSSIISGEIGRYTALKTLTGLISVVGYILLLVGVIALFYLGKELDLLYGLMALVLCVAISLPLLAFSNLIYVFIDIEHNTRKTFEELKSK